MNRESDSEENKGIDLPDGFFHSIHWDSFDTRNSDGTEPARLPGWNLTLAIPKQERNNQLAGALRNLESVRDTLGSALKNGSLTPGIIEQQMNTADNALDRVFATFLSRLRSRRRRQKDPTDSLRWLEGEFGRLKTLTHRTLSFCNHARQHSEGDIRAAFVDAVRLGILFIGEVINKVEQRQDDFWLNFSAGEFLDLKQTRNLIAHAQTVPDDEILNQAATTVRDVHAAVRRTFFPTGSETESGLFRIPGTVWDELPRMDPVLPGRPSAPDTIAMIMIGSRGRFVVRRVAPTSTEGNKGFRIASSEPEELHLQIFVR